MSYTLYLKQRVDLLGYQNIECGITQEFEDSFNPKLAQHMVEILLDSMIVGRLQDLLSLNKGNERDRMFYYVLEAFYSTPREERRKK